MIYQTTQKLNPSLVIFSLVREKIMSYERNQFNNEKPIDFTITAILQEAISEYHQGIPTQEIENEIAKKTITIMNKQLLTN